MIDGTEDGASPETGRRRDVLRVLRDATEPLSIVDIAGRLGVHPNTVRFHLDTLTRVGRVERVTTPRSGPGRPAARFRALRQMDPAGARNYRLLAEILVESLADDPDPAARAVDAGRQWGRRMVGSPDDWSATSLDQATGRLTALLDTLGFAPEQRSATGGRQIGLRHCPFLELVDTRASVVCPVHLGLMQGALDALRAPITVRGLEPFAEPDLCLAHLADTGSRPPTSGRPSMAGQPSVTGRPATSGRPSVTGQTTKGADVR